MNADKLLKNQLILLNQNQPALLTYTTYILNFFNEQNPVEAPFSGKLFLYIFHSKYGKNFLLKTDGSTE